MTAADANQYEVHCRSNANLINLLLRRKERQVSDVDGGGLPQRPLELLLVAIEAAITVFADLGVHQLRAAGPGMSVSQGAAKLCAEDRAKGTVTFCNLAMPVPPTPVAGRGGEAFKQLKFLQARCSCCAYVGTDPCCTTFSSQRPDFSAADFR